MKPRFLVFVACTLCASIVGAQISVDVTLVTLVATVTDSNGHYVPNLGQTDFTVIEDGKEQKIALVERSDDLPVSIGVLLDTSTSMRPKIETATAAIERFLRTLGPADDMFLMSFAGKPKLEQNFTNDRNKIAKALRKVQLNSRTALYDSIEQGIVKVRDGKHMKKALLLVTDGQDTNSTISLEQAIDDVRQSRVLLYCLGIGSSVRRLLSTAGQ